MADAEAADAFVEFYRTKLSKDITRPTEREILGWVDNLDTGTRQIYRELLMNEDSSWEVEAWVHLSLQKQKRDACSTHNSDAPELNDLPLNYTVLTYYTEDPVMKPFVKYFDGFLFRYGWSDRVPVCDGFDVVSRIEFASREIVEQHLAGQETLSVNEDLAYSIRMSYEYSVGVSPMSSLGISLRSTLPVLMANLLEVTLSLHDHGYVIRHWAFREECNALATVCLPGATEERNPADDVFYLGNLITTLLLKDTSWMTSKIDANDVDRLMQTVRECKLPAAHDRPPLTALISDFHLAFAGFLAEQYELAVADEFGAVNTTARKPDFKPGRRWNIARKRPREFQKLPTIEELE